MSTLKDEHRRKVASKLETAPESPVKEAAVEVLSGSMSFQEAKKVFGTSQFEIQKLIKQSFATEEDSYKFMEECMVANAMLSSSIFQKKYEDLTAIEAAKATAIFMGKAVEVRKAREAGFKEPPISVNVIVALEQTLKKLTNEKVKEL